MQMPMLNDATAQMGMQFGKQMGAAGQEYVRRNVSAGGKSAERDRRRVMGESTTRKCACAELLGDECCCLLLGSADPLSGYGGQAASRIAAGISDRS
jgi:hypothetical protein